MRKILFNDKLGLTQAVLEGRKTMTRRMVCTKDVRLPVHLSYDIKTRQLLLYDACLSLVERSRYAFDEVVAIAQSYKDINELGIVQTKPTQGDEYIWFGNDGGQECVWAENHAGWKNKMFVKAELMPHHIKIKSVRVERLQDISNEDCLREGVRLWEDAVPEYQSSPLGKLYEIAGRRDRYKSPREAFAALIDNVSGKGTWESNPLVWVYEFELVD